MRPRLFVIICLLIVALIGAFYFFGGREEPVISSLVSPTATALRSTSPTPLGKVLITDIPFTSQAPFGDWKDPRQQDGCEEASALMAMRWVTGKGLTKDEALREILAISAYEERTYGSYHDTNARDTVERIIKGYFSFAGARAISGIGVDDIKRELYAGHLVIVPINGQKLGNPNYTAPGPERHMLVMVGYDPARDEFTTNDPGTRKGAGYRYRSDVLAGALFDYPTGNHEPASGNATAMIVITK